MDAATLGSEGTSAPIANWWGGPAWGVASTALTCSSRKVDAKPNVCR
jgi:hypothetical protein